MADKSALNLILQKRGLKANYICKATTVGTVLKADVFHCTLFIPDTELQFAGTSGGHFSKKEAEQDAAKVALGYFTSLTELEQVIISNPTKSTPEAPAPPQISLKNVLQEYCQKKGAPPPTYSTTPSGRYFLGVVTVKLPNNPEPQIFSTGTHSYWTKKEAEQAAAEIAVQELAIELPKPKAPKPAPLQPKLAGQAPQPAQPASPPPLGTNWPTLGGQPQPKGPKPPPPAKPIDPSTLPTVPHITPRYMKKTANPEPLHAKNKAQNHITRYYPRSAPAYETNQREDKLFYCTMRIWEERAYWHPRDAPERKLLETYNSTGHPSKKEAETHAAQMFLDKLVADAKAKEEKTRRDIEKFQAKEKQRKLEEAARNAELLGQVMINKKYNAELDWQELVWEVILSRFDGRSLCTMTQVCIKYKEMASKDTLWYKFRPKNLHGAPMRPGYPMIQTVIAANTARFNEMIRTIESNAQRGHNICGYHLRVSRFESYKNVEGGKIELHFGKEPLVVEGGLPKHGKDFKCDNIGAWESSTSLNGTTLHKEIQQLFSNCTAVMNASHPGSRCNHYWKCGYVDLWVDVCCSKFFEFKGPEYTSN